MHTKSVVDLSFFECINSMDSHFVNAACDHFNVRWGSGASPVGASPLSLCIERTCPVNLIINESQLLTLIIWYNLYRIMVRNYKRKKQNPGGCTLDQIIRARAMVQDGISVRRIADELHIPFSTLRENLKRVC